MGIEELKSFVKRQLPEEVSHGEIVAEYENNSTIYDVRVYGGLTLTLTNRTERTFSLRDRVAVSFPLGAKAAGYITGIASLSKSSLVQSILVDDAEG